MSLSPGARLGPYEIVVPIGAGGMGEVYKARDTRLDRTVAIKVLPEHVASDPDARQRFEREARAVAALNHPHICTLYDIGRQDGTDFLVMEYLEGETLQDRLAKGALPLDQALRYGIEIADALDKAHRAGIVHRDLKPGNIMLTKSGSKLLDFGLAKTGTAVAAGTALSMMPTTPPNLTAQGTILGTLQYMAPEQLEGRVADARTDIFAFGAVLYEMLTAKKAFEGKSQASLIAAILEREPPLVSTIQPVTPAALDHVVRTCLAKNPDERWQTFTDLQRQLRWIVDSRLQPSIDQAAISHRRNRRAIISAGALAALAGLVGVGGTWMLKPEPSQPLRRFAIELPEGDQFSAVTRHIVALSPDGTRLVYVANQRLYQRAMDQLDATPVRGTEEGGPAGHGRSPFFSPDGQWIGFWQSGQLKKVSVNGGASITLCAAEEPRGASWGPDGMILFGQGAQGIAQVSANGGQPSTLISIDSKTESAHGPQMLPGGKAVLFTLASTAQQLTNVAAYWDDAQIVVQSLDSGQRTVVVQRGKDARYLSGHLLYVHEGTLLAVAFDAARLATKGSAFPVVDGIREAASTRGGGAAIGREAGSTGAAHFTVSQDGLFAYVPQNAAAAGGGRTLAWVDRQGHEIPLEAPNRAYVYPRISPDGNRVALDIRDEELDIWIWDLARETLTRFTFDPAADIQPTWTLDGQQIVFLRVGLGLFARAADGTGDTARLIESAANPAPTAFSHDGAQLVVHQIMSPQTDHIKMLSLDAKQSVDLLAQPKVHFQNADVSPDGRWLAYQSDESGQFEVYVRPFPDVQRGRWRVSRAGGTRPVWASSGRELFFLAPPPQPRGAGNASDVAMMAASIQPGPGFLAGNPTRLFTGSYYAALPGRTYDVSSDSRRFLMIKEKTTGRAATDRIIVVENFFEELKRLMSPN